MTLSHPCATRGFVGWALLPVPSSRLSPSRYLVARRRKADGQECPSYEESPQTRESRATSLKAGYWQTSAIVPAMFSFKPASIETDFCGGTSRDVPSGLVAIHEEAERFRRPHT